MKYFFLILALLTSLLSVDAQQDTTDEWELTNGPYSGHATIMAIDSSGRLLAGTEVGLYRFDEATERWTLMGLKGRQIRAITVRPNGDCPCFF